MSDLKPCPFCGGEAMPPKNDHARMWVIGCKKCNTEVWEKNDGHDVRDFIPRIEFAWNTRAPVSVQEAAKVLLNDRAALDRMVCVAEDIHCTGVSFNHEGKVIENSNREVKWGDVERPCWYNDIAYRVKPEPKRITVPLMADFKEIGTIDLVDGKPDLASIKLDDAEGGEA